MTPHANLPILYTKFFPISQVLQQKLANMKYSAGNLFDRAIKEIKIVGGRCLVSTFKNIYNYFLQKLVL